MQIHTLTLGTILVFLVEADHPYSLARSLQLMRSSLLRPYSQINSVMVFLTAQLSTLNSNRIEKPAFASDWLVGSKACLDFVPPSGFVVFSHVCTTVCDNTIVVVCG